MQTYNPTGRKETEKKIIKLTAENTKTLPLFIRDAEKRRKELEQVTGEKHKAVLTLACDK